MYNPEFGYGTEVYETEEERRRREAAQQPVTQKITYMPDGTQKMTITGTPESLSAANPNTPTVTGPVSPDETYRRMIQAESGGRQFNAQGGVLTSPRGALGVGQVMPATAMQPGYGVTNIFDLAQQRGVAVPSRDLAGAQQLLGNEQLNREFGQNYYNAMNQRFGSTGGVAAYNAGPGRVQANMAANAGQLNPAQLPNETQQYIQRVLGRVPAQAQAPQPIINDQGQVIGSETPNQMVAGAQTGAPVAPVAPGAQPQPQMVSTQAPTTQEQMGPSTQFMSPDSWVERFRGAQNDIGTLSSMLADPNLPQGGRMEIAAAISDQMRFQKMEAEKREQYTRGIETGNFSQLDREARKSGNGGSWLRYFMYGLMGSPNAEIEKQRLMPELYAKPDYITLADNQTRAVIMRDNNGNAIRGTTADGRPLTQKELIENGRPSGEYDIVGGTFVSDTMKDSQGNPMVGSLYRNKKNPSDQFIQTSEGKKPLSGFRPQSSQGSLSDMRARQIQQLNIDLQGKTEQEKMAITRAYNERLVGQGLQPVQPYEVQLAAPQVGGGTVAGQPAAAPTGQPTTTPAGQARPTQSQLEAQSGAQKDIAKAAGEVVAASQETQNLINKIDNTIVPVLESGKHNIGPALSVTQGRGPIAQAIGGQLETEDARNTRSVMETIDMLAIEGLKSLGANPSTRDLEFYTKNKPQANSDPEFVKSWIQSRSAALKRKLGYASTQMETGGGAGVAPPVQKPTVSNW